MGATRALLTLRFPDRRILYANGHQQAAMVLERLDLGPAGARERPDDVAQRAVVVEATMRVESLLGDGAPTPLAAAVRALRALNAACNSAKHGEIKVARRQDDQYDRSTLYSESNLGYLGEEAEQGSTSQNGQPGEGVRTDELLVKECKYKEKQPKKDKGG